MKMKKIVAIVLACVLAVGIFGATIASAEEAVESPVAGKKIAYIMKMTPATIFQMWAEHFVDTAEKLGMQADYFFCDDDAEKMQDRVRQCAAAGYDGLMISHADHEWAWTFLNEILAEYPDLKIVTFDTPFEDENGEVAKIDGVTQFFQRDAGFAAGLVEALMALPENAEKVAAGEPLNILQIQRLNFNSPFTRRQAGYAPYEEEGKIHTVEMIGPTNDQQATESMRTVAEATLAKYSDEDIDGIWCCYDVYAQGVYQALRDNKRQIPMVSVDICNEDIQFMTETQEDGSPSQWKACATTNWNLNGEFACRVLALELADQYDDIAAASCYFEDPGAWLEIPSTIVTQEQVTSQDGITIENLELVADESYSDTSWMPTCDWMVALLGY